MGHSRVVCSVTPTYSIHIRILYGKIQVKTHLSNFTCSSGIAPAKKKKTVLKSFSNILLAEFRSSVAIVVVAGKHSLTHTHTHTRLHRAQCTFIVVDAAVTFTLRINVPCHMPHTHTHILHTYSPTFISLAQKTTFRIVNFFEIKTVYFIRADINVYAVCAL